jgi:hypothetical protein
MFRARRIPTWLALLAATACGSGEPEGEGDRSQVEGSGSAVLAAGAQVLDDETLRALTKADPDGALSFAGSTAQLEGLDAGDVLILGPSDVLPRGALVKVEAVTRQGDGFVVSTRPAELTEAFQDLQVSLKALLARPAEVSPQPAGASSGIAQHRQALELSFPVRLSEGSGDQRMELQGAVSLGSSLDLELDFDLTSFTLEELSLTFAAQETFAAELVGQGQLSFDESLTVATVGFSPITLFLPIPAPPYTVPVVLTPQVTLRAALQGSIQGDVSASVTQRAGFTTGLGYRNGEFGGFAEDDSTFDFEHPEYHGSANIRASAGPRLDVLLYGAVGPYAGVDAFLEAGASLEGPPPCVQGIVDAGLRGRVGVDFLASYETTLFDQRYPIASFDGCSTDPDAPRPALTWSRSFGRTESPGEHAKAVVQASDGTFLAVGHSNAFGGVSGFAAAAWALRLDPLGNVLWQRAYRRDAEIGSIHGAAEVPGGFLLAGSAGLAKLDSGGNVVWARTYVAEEFVEMTSIAALADGSSVLVGRIGVTTEAWAMRVDARGEPVWSYRYSGVDFARVRGTSDGGWIAVGNANSNLGDVSVVKFGADGAVLWNVALDNRHDAAGGEGTGTLTSSTDRGYDVVEKPGGGFLVVGESYGAFPIPEPGPAGFYAGWVIELDAQGGLVSSVLHRAPRDANYGGLVAVGVPELGSPLFLGRHAVTTDDLLQGEDALLLRSGSYAALGGPGQDGVYGGTLAGVGRGMPLHMTADGGAILALTSDSFTGQEQFWLVKLNRAGTLPSPHRRLLEGASLSNEHTAAQSVEGAAEEVVVVASAFTLVTETTPWTGVDR